VKKPISNVGFEWSYRDLLMALLVVYMAMAVLALVAVTQSKTTAAAVSPGNVMIQMWWTPGTDADVDLWVEAPGDVAVGYSNRSGKTFNLLRDDTGRGSDPMSQNYELAVGRGTPAGEYTVNAHLYRSRDRQMPLEARLSVTVQNGGEPAEILSETILLTHEGDEQTAFRFSLSDQGELRAGSVHHIHKPIRVEKAR
jgi:hypothetical protein